jgi:AcrR family transcriptional regulator
MPKLWNETIEIHRDAVRAAILDAAAGLVGEHGVPGVTMSGVAEAAGIGRATLYKYFPDIESILTVWHERQVQSHLDELIQVKDRTVGVGQQVESVLQTYAFLSRSGHDDEAAVRLHQGGHTRRAQQQLHDFVVGMLREGAGSGVFRTDVAPEELAAFCLHALEAAAVLDSHDAVLRLVKVTLGALYPAPRSAARAGGHGTH